MSLIGRTLLLSIFLVACGPTNTTNIKQEKITEEQVETVVKVAEATEPLDLEKAKADYKKALRSVQEGDYDHAETLFLAMTENYPTLSGPYLNLGLSYQRKEQYEAAEKRFRQAILVQPENSIAYNQLGILLRTRGEFDTSLAMYEKAIEINSDYALAHLNMGILLDLYLVKPAEALAHYRIYQELTDKEDQKVAFWIVDLEQRLQPELSQTGSEF
ncbi:MAG: tetratricopeptide repeat protein [Candidatus Polarisedimenticolaceae bacterium]|nr:tetratricopeptide repeat protein [Candidatus Polarisedimenticolaceae bacterium]